MVFQLCLSGGRFSDRILGRAEIHNVAVLFILPILKLSVEACRCDLM